MNPSKPGTLNALDWRKWRDDVLYFLATPVTFYTSAVLGILQLEGHAFSLNDLIPSQFTIGAIVAYIFIQIQNILRKWVR